MNGIWRRQCIYLSHMATFKYECMKRCPMKVELWLRLVFGTLFLSLSMTGMHVSSSMSESGALNHRCDSQWWAGYSDGDDETCCPWILRYGLYTWVLKIFLCSTRIKRTTQSTWLPVLYARVVSLASVIELEVTSSFIIKSSISYLSCAGLIKKEEVISSSVNKARDTTLT